MDFSSAMRSGTAPRKWPASKFFGLHGPDEVLMVIGASSTFWLGAKPSSSAVR